MSDEPAVDEAAFDPDDPELQRAPQKMYRMLRDDAPVMEIDMGPTFHSTMVSRHEDVLAVLRNPEVFSSKADAVHIGQIRPMIPLQIDPPDHNKYRKLLDPLFAPKKVATLEASTRALVADLIDAVVDEGSCNFNHSVAEPLPSTVFLGLLGLPTSRAKEFIALKDGIIRPPAESPEERQEMVDETGAEIYKVLEEVVDARMAEPRDDWISGFLSSEVEGERLTREDVIDICYLFFLAGLDTVTASLDCMLAYLAQNPDQRQRLVDEPELIPHAIEEMLRWESPVAGVARITAKDTEIAGCPIAEGTMVAVSIGSANTDERAWDAADTVDFHREVNKHLAFGGGIHRCLGSHLARMELRVTLEEWHARVPEYRLPDGLELIYSQGLRQIENLELVW